MTAWVEDVDVSTSAGLASALDAVEASPEAWDSPLGRQVASEIVRLVPLKVGLGRVASLSWWTPVRPHGVRWWRIWLLRWWRCC